MTQTQTAWKKEYAISYRDETRFVLRLGILSASVINRSNGEPRLRLTTSDWLATIYGARELNKIFPSKEMAFEWVETELHKYASRLLHDTENVTRPE